jgi:hypothetical protein
MPIKQTLVKKTAPASTSRTLPKPGPNPADEEQEETTGRASSKEEAFDNAEPESGFGVPNGNYIANLVGAKLEKDESSEKESVMFEYEIKEGEAEGKTIKAWYSLFDKDGNQMKGMGFFKRDMEVLGQPSFKYAEIEDALQQLESERVEVNINVKQNGQWTNVYLQGLAQS